MFEFFKKLKRIVKDYDADQKSATARVDTLARAHGRIVELEALIRDRTDIAVDVRFREASHIIVVGRYKNADYVQSFTMRDTELEGLIRQLRDMERGGYVRRIDAVPEIRAVIKREIVA